MAKGQTIRLTGVGARVMAHRWVDIAPHGAVLNIHEANRTNEQNAKLWAMLSDISRAKPLGRDLTTEAWKCLFMDLIGHKPVWEPGLDGGVVNIGYRSSRLTKAEMSDMIEQMYAFGAEHGVVWSEPRSQEQRAA